MHLVNRKRTSAIWKGLLVRYLFLRNNRKRTIIFLKKSNPLDESENRGKSIVKGAFTIAVSELWGLRVKSTRLLHPLARNSWRHSSAAFSLKHFCTAFPIIQNCNGSNVNFVKIAQRLSFEVRESGCRTEALGHPIGNRKGFRNS